MAIFLFLIIALYTTALVSIYVRTTPLTFMIEERHLRYAGILFYLLLLVAFDQWRAPFSKAITILIVGVLAAYGLTSYANGARELLGGRYYDPVSGTSQQFVSPIVLEYLRSEMSTHSWENAIAVLPTPEAAVALPRFRIIEAHHGVAGRTWAGRAEMIFVVMNERLSSSEDSAALLKSFVDYEFGAWNQTQLDGMIVYSQ
jgi:hypothetical protein